LKQNPKRKEARKMKQENIQQSRPQHYAEKNLPEKKISTGAISATVWQNETVRNGQPGIYRTVTLQRSYKDKNDRWQTTSSFRLNDLPKAALVLNKAYEYLVLRESDPNSQQAVEDGVEEEIVI
jgi:hypothetical protein